VQPKKESGGIVDLIFDSNFWSEMGDMFLVMGKLCRGFGELPLEEKKMLARSDTAKALMLPMDSAEPIEISSKEADG
jgi:hypothetical protein